MVMLAEIATMPEASVLCPDPIKPLPPRSGWSSNSLSRAKLEHMAGEVEELAILYQVGLALGSSLDLCQTLWTLYRETGRLVDTSSFALALYEGGGDRVSFRLVFDQNEQVDPFSIRLSENRGLTGRVLAARAPLLIRDLAQTNQAVEMDQVRPDQPIRSWLAVPIRDPKSSDAEAQGVIAVWSYRSGAFSERDLHLLTAVADQAAIAICNARLFQSKERRIEQIRAHNKALGSENAHLHESLLEERDRVVEAGEQVRKELARDLHDGPTQLVSAIMMQLDFCQKLLEKDPSLLPKQFSTMQDLGRQAIHQMRTMLFELRPLVLETQGLAAALRVLVERQQEEAVGTNLTLAVETFQPSGGFSRQEAKVEEAIYAIVQEAVTNALKHAKADHIGVRLQETRDAIYVTVLDDGQGFDMDQVMSGYEKQVSLGMVNVRERADLIGGELSIESKLGLGTRITLCVSKAKEERAKKRGTTGRLSLRPGTPEKQNSGQ